MTATTVMTAAAVATPQSKLPPWLQTQLTALLCQRGHAWLLSGPSGLGQFDLGLALAQSWLCDAPTPHGACGVCASCHAVSVHTHADLSVLLPEVLALELGWPLDEKTQDELDSKKRKPSKEIKVDAARDVVTFTQFTRSRGTTKVVLVYPAERMNGITANTLLKTLEEPPGAVKFILATEAAHQLLPTIRSRCLSHTMTWPKFDDALAWLAGVAASDDVDAAKLAKGVKTPSLAELKILLAACGGRPADVLPWLQSGQASQAAKSWQALPKAMVKGDASALSEWAPAQAVDALQKICHDVLAVRCGAPPRFFSLDDLPAQASQVPLLALGNWSKELAATARTVEHPFNAGLMLESLASRAKVALTQK